MKKQGAMRNAPSEQCDYVSEGSAADSYMQTYKHNTIKHNIYRGVAQLVARLLWEQDAGCSSHLTPTKNAALTAREPQGETLRLLNSREKT